MKKIAISFLLTIYYINIYAQNIQTVFEKTNGKESATYFETIQFYKKLAATNAAVSIKDFGLTDAGYPLQLVLVSNDKSFNPTQWQQKVVVFINNGIHPGEPDGIDASQILVRDILAKKNLLPTNIVLAIIPVYNIGGSLNRSPYSRVNQNGPTEYGFRGNAQNLDLNRDFIKCDSKNAREFTKIFHWLNPDIFIDNHVSDGADYQHTMTMLTTQHNKLGGEIGKYLHDVFEPLLYKNMQQKNWIMCPYVNFEMGNPDRGWDAYYDSPRYSSGYAVLFQIMAFVPETHMLKPYADRVKSTYAFMQAVIEEASKQATTIKQKRKESIEAVMQQKQFAIQWKVDSSKIDTINFMGYETGKKISDVSGLNRMFYDHSKPFTKPVKYYNYFVGTKFVSKPKAYIIPQGWWTVTDLLKLNNVHMQQLKKDTLIEVTAYHIDNYKTSTRAYEKHYTHNDVTVSANLQKIKFLKGDYIIYTGQKADRFLVETLEPEAYDSYFVWNFFDAVLQQKEGYSNYRWEDVAGVYIQQHPELKEKLEAKRKTDASFANNAFAQLDFVYKNSPYYEPAHLRYPVYRLN
ncbi:MAG: M14 family metallopeptidase [Bacteroidetes bacterium]|nr:M14 family metallopeptidase [Bacteroidota bacterium]MBS1648182.1 M14 family metallopeptidase [Bacteroidota bacterium]